MERESKKIRVWMLENDLRFVHIRRDLGLRNAKQIMQTVDGERDHRNTLKWLVDKGCPVGLLNLPVDMREAA